MEEQQIDSALATAHRLLQAESLSKAADIVRSATVRVESAGTDNWNGGTDLWDVFLEVPAEEFARMGNQRSEWEEQITLRLKTVLEPGTSDWYAVKIVPARERKTGWRAENSSLPREVRKNILDAVRLENVDWRGDLNDVEFLSRLYDLTKLPSHDTRYTDAARDIWQHCINNHDWDDDWVFSDRRFGLSDGDASTFLRFLCETVHPVVRPDRNTALKLVSLYNEQLRGGGWEIVEEDRIAGRPRFTFRSVVHHGQRAVSRARSVADALDAGAMAKTIERLERSIDDDPDLAIGTAKDLVESCCKTILGKRGVEFSKAADLNDLTKLLFKELQLVPEGVSEQAKGSENIRLILRNLTQLTQNLAQLRGLYGTGHGRDGKHRGLQPRHARLAVAAAVAFVDFATGTYRERASKTSE
jgi:hypothetical protein